MASAVVAILGMHRSGTSWLAGSLQQLGLPLGNVNVVARHNERGNRESTTLRRIHNGVLADNGASWRRPTWPNTWSPKRQRALSAQIESMNGRYPIWGFKDPRTLMVMEEWRRQIPDLARVGIYRHPNAVYRSLKGRHADFTYEEALALWRRYNVRLLDELRLEPFPLIRFDGDPETLRAALISVGSALGLPSDGAPAFFDQSLVHNDHTASEPVPADVADIWSSLEGYSLLSTSSRRRGPIVGPFPSAFRR